MNRIRFAELVLSFNELSCGVCSEDFEENELSKFQEICIALLNRDTILDRDLSNLFDD